MNWYFKKDLAVLIQEDPIIFKLKFEPRKKGVPDLKSLSDDTRSYTELRENCCVVCGQKENFLRFHIIPLIFRNYFPTQFKSRSYEEVVILCYECNLKALKLYDEKIVALTKLYNITDDSCDNKDYKNIQGVLLKAKSFLKNNDNIPEVRKIEMSRLIISFLTNEENYIKYRQLYKYIFDGKEIKETIECNKGTHSTDCINFKNINIILKQYIKDEIITKELLLKISTYKISDITKSDKNIKGKLVIDKVKDLNEFIRDWRLYFIDKMNPKYVPDELLHHLQRKI